MMMEAKRQAYWWWFDSHNSPKYSPWLRSTLSELEDKTKAMLKLIEEDADSFAQRAEMYYKKRPELISMVEDFYRAYRSLAERYDQQKMDPLTRVKSPLRHSMPDLKTELGLKSFPGFPDESYSSSSEESAESEVDDPEIDYEDHDMVVVGDENEDEDELMKMRRELEKLQEESEIQRSVIKQSVKEAEELRNFMERMKLENVKLKEEMKKKEKERSEMLRGLEKAKYELMITREEMQAQARDQQEALAQKDEEKREVIRQLSLSMEMLREEKRLLKKSIMIRDVPKKQNTPDFQIFKGFGLGNLFGLPPKSMSIVPL